ncbi:MAG TPA: tRNA pseudouridine(55) synthase TruB [Paludibacteraceae bacterium]|jgi:tRNA pseudouridine55 synthase|nr:tRNA pseudouridine(55) synthase TruB [Paludibacteraceae bacterium]HOF98509.1 tRNA pseudouridine(55) synthase TruB [Paludibacteraceae bacterium]HOJ66110.1 tRNA pseudouridine(55) synthase TruB [Paludibacteraceae bacterium]HON01516.1 tRNA pseudouridine(55) synthase TruB [Paludibacteraceae bacterium]HOR39069.1 tRNA pseudouridine(55) synthase TruB [Paludibacteraceae bacterium]
MDVFKGEVFYVDKPLHLTSFNVVNRLRWKIKKVAGIKKIKVGHAGTLDPEATGVMIICTGKATKQIESFQSQTKEYIAELKLGATTPSFDMELPVNAVYPTEHITRELIDQVVSTFIGEIEQIPPIFSAVKIDGKRAYEYARNGQEIELKPKKLVIDEIEILNFVPPTLTLRIVCSKGTYIRALARDIGFALNSGSFLTSLRRIRIGNVRIDDCWDIENLLNHLDKELKSTE